MKPLVVIPARGGSKGIPGKNIKPLHGKPLIHYTIEVARAVFGDDQILVSTDSEEIRSCVEETGLKVPFLRPEALATDTAGTYEVLLHAIAFSEQNGYAPDTLVVLQPTSPFRTAQHLREAVESYGKTPADMLASVKETDANPYYVLFEENEEGFLRKSKTGNFTRRQDCPAVWELNGSIYIISVESLKKGPVSEFERIVKYEMDGFSSLDLDTPLDWKMAELMLNDQNEK